MKLEIKGKEYNLRLLCGKFRELKDVAGGDILQSMMDAMGNSDAEALGKALRVMCVEPKLTNEQAYAVLDGYLEEGHTVMEFGNVLMGVLDESGFLPQRGMAAAIQEQTEKAMSAVSEKIAEASEKPLEFAGFKA